MCRRNKFLLILIVEPEHLSPRAEGESCARGHEEGVFRVEGQVISFHFLSLLASLYPSTGTRTVHLTWVFNIFQILRERKTGSDPQIVRRF